MLSDIIISFTDRIKKTTNPFFGTFLIVWVVRNWQFLITLFNLDLYPTMDTKFEALKTYFVDETIVIGFFKTAGISLLVLIITYAFLNLGRLISNLYEKKLTPFIYKVTDNSSVVLRSDYDSLMGRLIKVEAKLSEERAARISVEQERDQLEERRKTELATKVQREVESSKNIDGGDAKSFSIAPSGPDKKMTQIHKVIDSKNLIKVFNEVLGRVLTDQAVSSEQIKPFVNLGLFKATRDANYYELTPTGDSYRNYLITLGLVE